MIWTDRDRHGQGTEAGGVASRCAVVVVAVGVALCLLLGGGETAEGGLGNLFISDAERDRAAAERARAEAFRRESEARAYERQADADADAADRAALRGMAMDGGGWNPVAVLLVGFGLCALVWIWRGEVAAFIFWREELMDLERTRRELDDTRLELARVRDRLALAEPVTVTPEYGEE